MSVEAPNNADQTDNADQISKHGSHSDT
jgi:hypothetical protein